MDLFGIGLAMAGMARTYLQASRRSGRTTMLLDSLRAGDRVCCATRSDAEYLRRKCMQRKLDIEIIHVPPENAYRLLERERSKGRTVFDHMWVEQFYLNAIHDCQQHIDGLQERASELNESPIEPPRLSVERARWGM